MGIRRTAFEVEHIPGWKNDGQRFDPLARGAVLERGCAGGIGCDDPADERSEERRRRWIVPSRVGQRRFELGKSDARLNAHRRLANVDDPVQSGSAEDHVAERRRAARQRRLRADRQRRRGTLQRRGDLGLGRGMDDSDGVAAWKMRCVLEERSDDVGVAVRLEPVRLTLRLSCVQPPRRHGRILDG